MIGDDQSALAWRPAGRRLDDRRGAAAIDDRGRIRLAQRVGRRRVRPAECAGVDLSKLVEQQDCEMLAEAAEDGGNPVIGLVELLRGRAAPAVSWWIHRGLTSQDVLDTALMLGARDAIDHLKVVVKEQISTLSG
ncbi:putative 3-carboxy-cis,cis-muconate cycloisomerase [Mycobacterium xenopi 3993]|nr:putative 3-carboxy-cis,cis-muconate cycloisomerase [Mycobacterium xenopi 3993]